MHGMSPLQRGSRHFAKADVVDLALFNKGAQTIHTLFDRGCVTHSVKIKEVDSLHAKPLKGFVTAADDIVRRIVDGAGVGIVRRAIDAALRGDFELVASVFIQPGKKVTD